MGFAPRQSQFQYHVSEEPVASVLGALLAGVSGAVDVVVAAWGCAALEVCVGAAAAPVPTLSCVSAPLSPGLSIRMLTLMFAAPVAAGWTAAEDAGGVTVAGFSATEGVSAPVSPALVAIPSSDARSGGALSGCGATCGRS